jgi:hypothetical protein
VACCLDRGSVQGRYHPTRKPHARDVPLRVDIDLYGNIAARAAGRTFLRVGSWLLFQHLRRLDRGCFRDLSTPDGLCCKQSTESKSKTHAVLERS